MLLFGGLRHREMGKQGRGEAEYGEIRAKKMPPGGKRAKGSEMQRNAGKSPSNPIQSYPIQSYPNLWRIRGADKPPARTGFPLPSTQDAVCCRGKGRCREKGYGWTRTGLRRAVPGRGREGDCLYPELEAAFADLAGGGIRYPDHVDILREHHQSVLRRYGEPVLHGA